MLRIALVSTFVLNFCFQFSHAQFIGGSLNDAGSSFCELDNGGLFLFGTTRSYGAGSDDMLVVKLDSSLNFQKNIFYGWSTYDVASKMIKTHNNQVVTTGYSWSAPGPGGRGDVVVNKYGSTGCLMWSSYFGGISNDYSSSIIETLDHGYVLTGVDEGGASKGDVYFYKLKEDGTKEWGHVYQSTTKDMGMDVIQCSDSSYLIIVNSDTFHGKLANASEYSGSEPSKIKIIKTDKLGNELWSKFYGGDDYDFVKSIVAYGGSFYFIGSSKNGPLGSFDIALHKIDKSGNVLWLKHYGGTDYDYGNSVDVNLNGELLITGSSSSGNASSSSDLYVAKLSTNGNVLWEKYIDNGWSDYGEQGLFLGNQQIAVIGTATMSDLSTEVYFKKFNTDGSDAVSQEIVTTDGAEIVFNVAPNPSNGCFQIDFENYENMKVFFELFDTNGKKFFSSDVVSNQTINLHGKLAVGLYVYKIRAGTDLQSGIIIIN